MEEFWKAAGMVLIAVILGLAVEKQEKDISVLLTMAVCCIVSVTVVSYLRPVVDLLWELEAMADLQGGLLGILLKAAGISVVAELAGMICNDAGNASLGKVLQLLGSAAIMYLSIPMINTLLTMIREILGML